MCLYKLVSLSVPTASCSERVHTWTRLSWAPEEDPGVLVRGQRLCPLKLSCPLSQGWGQCPELGTVLWVSRRVPAGSGDRVRRCRTGLCLPGHGSCGPTPSEFCSNGKIPAGSHQAGLIPCFGGQAGHCSLSNVPMSTQPLPLLLWAPWAGCPWCIPASATLHSPRSPGSPFPTTTPQCS